MSAVWQHKRKNIKTNTIVAFLLFSLGFCQLYFFLMSQWITGMCSKAKTSVLKKQRWECIVVQLQLQKRELSFTDIELSPWVCKEAGAKTHFGDNFDDQWLFKFSTVTFSSWCEKGEQNPQNFLLHCEQCFILAYIQRFMWQEYLLLKQGRQSKETIRVCKSRKLFRERGEMSKTG